MTELSKEFRVGWFRRHRNIVLQDVNFSIREGERVGITGPSGEGKTTLARIIVGLLSPSSGNVEFRNGKSTVPKQERTLLRRNIQLVYQDADLSLDPAQTVGDGLVEAYQIFDDRLTWEECYRLGRLPGTSIWRCHQS